VANVLDAQYSFNPSSHFMACRPSRLIQVDYAEPYIFSGWTFFWPAAIAWVSFILNLNNQFAFNFPWSNASRHLGKAPLMNKEILEANNDY
jgi:hypothetical protein